MRNVSAEDTTGNSPCKLELATATEQVGDREVPQDLITPREVAALFCVNPKTVTRWAVAGRLTAYRTLGGHRRFSRAQIEQLLVVHPKAS
jgi:excisionase family DNA binding protein